MRRAASITSVAFLIVGSGCVQQDKFDHARMSVLTQEEMILSLEQELDGAKTDLRTARKQLTEAKAQNGSLQTRINGLNEQVQTQARRYDGLLRRVSQLEFGPLPVELEVALDQLASAYPNLLSFDATTGMLRFASDFTFDLGSAELKPNAAATIATLADILNAEQASPFELRIIGHTDNVPIERPATRQKHPTNMHLSVHRAISVRKALTGAGVEPARIQVAGYGEFRPIVPNGSKGAAANRRVDLILVPMPQRLAEQETSRTPAGRRTVTADPEK